jgi:hypothetical protein
MKYKTFRALVMGGGLLAGFGACWAVCSADEPLPRAARPGAADAASAGGGAGNPASRFAASPGLRDVDRDMLALLRSPVVEKIKDGTAGKPYKINLYSDDRVRFNRAKVDLDRDEKADESWSFDAEGNITRKVAPADDEHYTQTLRLDLMSGWLDLTTGALPQADASRTPTPAAGVGTGGGTGPRDIDRDMAALLKMPVQQKIKDATKGKPYKINLYSDDGLRFQRAKVDLDRDDKWDESWTFGADGSTERQVAPADDERYAEVWVLHAGTWTKK